MQMPPIAAITGLVALSTTAIAVRNVGSASILGVPNSRMSAPLEKTFAEPMSMIALTPASASACSMPATICLRSACEKPFIGGLSKVITATSPCNW